MKMFSVKDTKAEGFNTPFFQQTFGMAERSFLDAIRDEKNPMYKHQADYSLYCTGEFNQTTGECTPIYPPKLIVEGKNLPQ